MYLEECILPRFVCNGNTDTNDTNDTNNTNDTNDTNDYIFFFKINIK